MQVSEGRVYDSVLVAAEGIKRTMNSGVDLSKPRSYVGFCGDLKKQPENANGKQLARYLSQVVAHLTLCFTIKITKTTLFKKKK